jgi:excinuclease ABC subunit C
MSVSKLKDKSADLTERPGVYLFKDARGRVLYVGKAKNLRKRVAQYFQERPDREPRTAAMLRHAVDLETIETETEVEALLAESRLIKDIQPKYNVSLKDGKSFPLLAVSKGEDFPKVYVTRERNPDTAVYYGPFLDATGLREAVSLLQHVFRFRTCDLAIRAKDPKNRRFRPCLLFSIGRCTAPCADRIGRKAYREDIRAFRKVLSGKKHDLLASLRRRMGDAAGTLDFEQAARLRDQVQALESLARRGPFGGGLADETGALEPIDPATALADLQRFLALPAAPRTIEGVDIAHLQGGEAVGSLVSFIDGLPFKDGYRRFRIKGSAPPPGTLPDGGDDFAMIREVVQRRFARLASEGEVFPQILLVDGGIGQLRSAAEAIEELKIEPPPVVLALAKKEETLYRWQQAGPVRAQRRDLGLRLLMAVRDEAHRFAQNYHHILRRKKTLGSKKAAPPGKRPASKP